MQFDAVTIVVIAGVVAVLVLALASGRRRGADLAGGGQRPSGWRGSAVYVALFGATAATSHPDDGLRGVDDHGVGGDWAGGHGGGDSGGGGWGGGDGGGGGGDGGGGGGGGD